jgi:hypothetical protein
VEIGSSSRAATTLGRETLVSALGISADRFSADDFGSGTKMAFAHLIMAHKIDQEGYHWERNFSNPASILGIAPNSASYTDYPL